MKSINLSSVSTLALCCLLYGEQRELCADRLASPRNCQGFSSSNLGLKASWNSRSGLFSEGIDSHFLQATQSHLLCLYLSLLLFIVTAVIVP